MRGSQKPSLLYGQREHDFENSAARKRLSEERKRHRQYIKDLLPQKETLLNHHHNAAKAVEALITDVATLSPEMISEYFTDSTLFWRLVLLHIDDEERSADKAAYLAIEALDTASNNLSSGDAFIRCSREVQDQALQSALAALRSKETQLNIDVAKLSDELNALDT